jgi:hypothetical protein
VTPTKEILSGLVDLDKLVKKERRVEDLRLNLVDIIQEQREVSAAFGEMARDLKLRKEQSEERLAMVRELRTAEQICRMPDLECRNLAASLLGESEKGATAALVENVFKERLWELELALEDRGWVRETTLAALEFSRYGVQQLIRICRIYGIKNPIVKRISEICELYVFGRGIEIRAEDDTANQTIQDFLQANDAEMGHNGLAAKEKCIQTDGALYFGLATDLGGNVRVVMIDPLEIMDVITDADDAAKPLYFKRQWNRMVLDVQGGRMNPENQMCWYPSLELFNDAPRLKPQMMGGIKVNWNMPVLRRSAGGSPAKWRWPVPPVYAAVDWARAYKDALEDYATVRRTLARFALMVETKGGPGAIAAYNALFSTTLADGSGTQIERNPPPVVGSVHTGGPGTKVDAFKSAGAQANPEETRRLLLMACAAAGMPETFFGDASTGSLATAVSLDRPTELKFTAIQRAVHHTVKQILKYVLAVSGTSIGGRMREAAKKPKDVEIIIKFPNVIEHLIQPMIQAITEIATCGGRNGISAGIVDRRTIASLLLTEIGYEHVDKLLDKIYGTKYDPANDVTDQRSQVPPQSLGQATGKALDDLSIPPPLPPPPPPLPLSSPAAAATKAPAVSPPAAPASPAKHPTPAVTPPKSSAKPKAATAAAKKEALSSAVEALRAVTAKD